jgi:hypothetical protein
METVGRKGRYQLKKRPREYPRTLQQEEFLNALDFCDVKPGISKEDLMDKMKNCIPRYYKEHQNDNQSVHVEKLPAMPGSQ